MSASGSPELLPTHCPRRAPFSSVSGILASLGLLATFGGCNPNDQSLAIPPPTDSLHFPAGAVVDPRTFGTQSPCATDIECTNGEVCLESKCQAAARWLFVSNADADRIYDGGTVAPVDLNLLMAALDLPVRGQFGGNPKIAPVGEALSSALPCRRGLSVRARIECEESFFIASEQTVAVGKFLGSPYPVVDAANQLHLFVAVRGDPSVVSIDANLNGGDAGDIVLNCGQEGDSRTCAGANVMSHIRGDANLDRIDLEPYTFASTPTLVDGTQRDLLLVGHRWSRYGDTGDISLFGLNGAWPASDRNGYAPSFLSKTPSFAFGVGGMAVRPCQIGNAPTLTHECATPLLYVAPYLDVSIWMMGLLRPGLDSSQAPCVSPSELGQVPGSRLCDESIDFASVTSFAAQGPVRPIGGQDIGQRFGEMVFSRDGNLLVMIHTLPSALVAIDTSLDPVTNQPFNRGLGVVEICDSPRSVALYEDGDHQMALVSCFDKAELAVVDLSLLELVTQIRVGVGPAHISIDSVRQLAYIANYLESSVSIVDLSRNRASRFSEIARLGLPEPFKQ